MLVMQRKHIAQLLLLCSKEEKYQIFYVRLKKILHDRIMKKLFRNEDKLSRNFGKPLNAINRYHFRNKRIGLLI